MNEIRQILVVSRSTADCKKAFRYGVALAKSFGARLSILHIEHDPLLKWGAFAVPRLIDLEEECRATMKKVRKELDEMIQEQRAQGIISKEIIKDGDPVNEIMTTVENEKVDLLILAAYEEGRIEHIIYGRFNHDVVRKLPCSICLVRGE